MSFRGCVALFALAALASASVVRAQDTARASAAARALFQEGVACVDHEDWACAVQRFGEAYRLRASPVIGSNYGIALMHVGRLVEASEAFRAVERDASASAQLRADAAHYGAEIAPRLGRLTITASGPMDGVTITVDGRDETSFVGVAAPSDPGDHVVEAHRDGELVASAPAHVEAAARVEVALTIPPRAAPAIAGEEVAPVVSVAPVVTEDLSGRAVLGAEPAPPAHQPEVYEEWWFWTLIGVGVAAGVGVTAGVVASQGTVPPMGSLGTIDARP